MLQAEDPPESHPPILWLNPEITDCSNEDSNSDPETKSGYSVLAVPEAVLVPYNLQQRQGRPRKVPPPNAAEVVARPYFKQARHPPVRLEKSDNATQLLKSIFKNVEVSLPLGIVYKDFLPSEE